VAALGDLVAAQIWHANIEYTYVGPKAFSHGPKWDEPQGSPQLIRRDRDEFTARDRDRKKGVGGARSLIANYDYPTRQTRLACSD
jgi:hypothetical protein